MTKAIIFDVGGVLYKNEMPYVHKDIIRSLGVKKEVHERHYSELIKPLGKGEISEEQFWQKYLKATKASKPLPKKSLFVREYSKRYKPRKKVVDILKKLKANGYQLAMLSNTIEPHARLVKKMQIYGLFDITIFSNEVGLLKPDEKIFSLALKKLGSSPKEAIFIDDKEEHVSAANNFGLKGIIFKNPNQLTSELGKLGITSEEKFYAGGFLYNPKTKEVLLHLRDNRTKNNPNLWAFFGGVNKKGEKPQETFKRELYEELGNYLSNSTIKPLCNYFNPDFKTHRYVFYSKISTKLENLELKEGKEFCWFTFKEAFKQFLSKRTRQDLLFFKKTLL